VDWRAAKEWLLRRAPDDWKGDNDSAPEEPIKVRVDEPAKAFAALAPLTDVEDAQIIEEGGDGDRDESA
jgi:hypothetical protein